MGLRFMPPIPGLKAAGVEEGAEDPDPDADTDGDEDGDAGGRSPPDGPGVVAAECGAIGGTAIAVVFAGGGVPVAPTTGATPPGILIVGMPMIVAERGGMPAFAAAAAAAAAAAGVGAEAAAAAGFAGVAAGADAAAA